MGKRKRIAAKNQQVETTEKENEVALVRTSDQPVIKKAKWTNKQRIMVMAARGITFRDRHLMVDVREMMPHSKTESKMERKEPLFVLNEICEMKNCNKCIFFEGRKKQDLYMWISNIPKGPSAKFYVENVHTMKELKMTGNCLKGTRPFLSFDSSFNSHPHWTLLKELLTQIFSTPRNHPKSQPFFDHVFTFAIIENRIWFRNYQIIEEDGQLAEIGPRFVLNPIRIFEGSFGGATLWENSEYVTPNTYRRLLNMESGMKYRQRLDQKLSLAARKPTENLTDLDPLDEDIFKDPEPVEEQVESDEENIKKKPKKKQKKKKGKAQTKQVVVAQESDTDGDDDE